MSTVFSRFRHAVSVLVAEDRPDFKRVDASRVSYDDGTWLQSPSMQQTLIRRVYA
jgi:hypothetical protein